jgi:predicted nucleic acid-binding protein
MYLLDTMVLSELRKSRRDGNLVAWFEHVRPTDVYLSVVTIGEVERGIAKQQRLAPAFAQRLADWLDGTLRYYATRILSVDLGTARRWGRLSDTHGHAGADLLIAATAIEHGLAVVTRNVRHFEGTGVALVNPFRM